jgi:porphyrinogen peroxidase
MPSTQRFEVRNHLEGDRIMNQLADSFLDIQALMGTGFMHLRQGRYHLLRVVESDLARRWLSKVLQSGLVKSLAEVRKPDSTSDADVKSGSFQSNSRECLTVAFSHAGLLAMGLQEDPERPFPTAFRAGMAHPVRRRLLGDEPDKRGRLEQWEWGDSGANDNAAVHLMIAHYWADDHRPADFFDAAYLAQSGLITSRSVDTFPGAIRMGLGGRPTMHEPFGFQDGAGQPRIRGISLSTPSAEGKKRHSLNATDDQLIAPGEFLLGHRNEYGEISHCPDVANWQPWECGPTHFSINGSYLVAQQIHQDVEAFKKVVATAGVDRLGSKMMGRRMNAWPLVGGPLPAENRDDFLYLAGDAPGFECPRGAHIRRAHPRDALAETVNEGIQSAKLHRLLRRGRVYADSPSTQSSGDGIMFIALNADLDRQFEFVQRNWIMGSRFGDLSDEQDPILGVRPDRTFTAPGCPVGQRVGPLPRFTRVRGGGYFFMPGLRALRFMAGLTLGLQRG